MVKIMKKSLLAVILAVFMAVVPALSVSAAENDGSYSGSNQLSPVITVDSYNVNGSVTGGSVFKLSVNLKNTSRDIDVQNVTVRVSGGDAFGVNNGTDSVYTDKIAKNSTYGFSKNMMCASSVENGVYPIGISVNYEYFDSEGEKGSGSQEFNISIKASKQSTSQAAPQALTPQVLISSFSFGGDTVNGGEKFNLNFTVKNNSSSVTVKNVLIKLTGGESFVVADGTDTVAVNSLSPGGSAKISKQFQCLASVNSGVYPVTASITYEYYEGGEKAQGTCELTMSVPVVQPDKVAFEGISLADKNVTVNQETDCPFQIINSGKTKLSNGKVILKDDAGNELASAYIGNLEAGTQFVSNYTLPVTFTEMGVKNLIFVFEYENENSEKESIEQPFKVTVEKEFDPYEDTDTTDNSETEEKSSPVVPIVCGVAGVAALVVAAIIIAKVVKKKKLTKGSEVIDEEI